MHSFASTLILVALAVLARAIPVALPSTYNVNVPSVQQASIRLSSVSHSARTITSFGQHNFVEGKVEAVADSAQRRDDEYRTTDSAINIPRASVAAIYTNLWNDTRSFTEQSNTTKATHIISLIKASIGQALCELDFLNDEQSDTILGPADGGAQLTDSQLASIMANAIHPIFRAITNVLEDDVQTVFAFGDLFDDIGDLVESTTDLVPGLSSLIEPRSVSS